MCRVWLALVALGLTLTIALSVEAALRVVVPHGASPPTAYARAGRQAADRFPGAPLLRGGRDIAAPGRGATGTIALPALPIPAAVADALAMANVGVVPAAPFSMAHIRPVDRGRAAECLTAAIYYEAASESDAGQRAVAQAILNRVRHPAFPATVCGVVYQGSDHAGCQFSFACDGAMARAPARAAWARAARVAGMALAGYVYAPVGLATHYHTYAVTPGWNRAMVMTDAVGAHFFHRWKGYWGTAAAFRQVYVGGEPVPGPRAAIPAAAMPVVIATTAAAPRAPAVAIPRTAPVAIDTLPPAPQILERWKDAGRPLR